MRKSIKLLVGLVAGKLLGEGIGDMGGLAAGENEENGGCGPD